MNKPFGRRPPRTGATQLNPRDAVLARWRRIDLTEEESARRNGAKSAGEILPGVLKSLGLERKRSELEILKVWNNLIDPLVVAHAKPVGLAKGTLFVHVDSNAWLDEIVRYRRHEILKRLKSSFGPDLIQRISFRVG